MGDYKRVDKIQRMMRDYNISYDWAYYISYAREDDLTIEELKMRLDNPNIGQLPEWLSEKSLSDMIWKTIHKYRSSYTSALRSDEDLYQDLQLLVRKKSNKLVNFKCLKAVLSNYMQNIIATDKVYFNYFPTSLDIPVSEDTITTRRDFLYNDIDDKTTYATKSSFGVMNSEIDDLRDLIKSIKDDNIKNFLIVIGYIMCELDSLEDLYKELYNKSTDVVKRNLDDLEERLNFNRELIINDGFYNGVKSRKKSITPEIIIKSLDLTKSKSNSEFNDMTVSNILSEFRYFIKSTNLLSNNA